MSSIEVGDTIWKDAILNKWYREQEGEIGRRAYVVERVNWAAGVVYVVGELGQKKIVEMGKIR